MKLSCIIVDDEPGAVLIMENYIAKLDFLELTGKFFNALEAFHFMRNNRVDILLLDINMPEVNGFGLLDMVIDKPATIFTTAYSEHAVKAFDYNAIDYLRKPIRFERFVTAVEKARILCSKEDTRRSETIELRIDNESTLLRIADIYYIEGLRNYVKIHLANSMRMVLMTMNEIENKLPRDQFVRIHRSYIINSAKIKRTGLGSLYIHGACLPIGKTYKKYFNEFLKRL